jgi:PEP-CTERM motif
VTLIGDTGFDRLGGIAFNTSGVLYGVAGGSASIATLLTINPGTGAATTVGTVSGGFAVDGLRFDAMNTLYGAEFDISGGVGVLLTIDSTNAGVLSQVTLSGSGNSFIVGLAFSSGGALYGSRGNSSGHTEDLDLIDPATGQLSPLGDATNVISDLVFGSDGFLYGGSSTGSVFRINPNTGTKTLLFSTGLRLAGLASLPVPEPSTWILLFGGPLLVVAARIRRSGLAK